MCINYTPFYYQISTQKWLFELTNAKKTRVFICVMCRYGYYGKQAKTRKNEHESMKGSKAGAGKQFSRPDHYSSSIRQSQPWRIIIWQEWSLDYCFIKRQNWPSKFHKIQIWSLYIFNTKNLPMHQHPSPFNFLPQAQPNKYIPWPNTKPDPAPWSNNIKKIVTRAPFVTFTQKHYSSNSY